MSKFDPHYQWLGIPPAEQPADHYRLLGLTVFEPDPTVIENAADQRALLVRGFAGGKHAKDAQRLLNEVSAAKLALIKPDSKAKYDRSLRETAPSSISRRRVGEMRVEPPGEAGQGDVDDFVAATSAIQSRIVSPSGIDAAASSVRSGKRRKKQKPSTAYYLMGGGAAVFLAALFFVLRGSSGSNDTDTDDKPTASIAIKSISDRTTNVGSELVVKAKTSTKGKIKKSPHFSLESGSPSNAEIDRKSGEIRWKPTSRDAGRKHLIRVRVEAGKLRDTMHFAVSVPKVNKPPKIANLLDRDAKVGTRVEFDIRASDGPGKRVSYRLVSKLAGASVGAKSGRFRWQPAAEHGGKIFTIQVGVTGEQGAEAIAKFTINVAKYVDRASQPIQLSESIDTARDVVVGDSWRLLGNLLSVDKESAARLVLNATPPWSQYVLASTVRFDGDALAAGLMANDRQILAVLGDSKEKSGLRATDGTLVGAVKTNGMNSLALGRGSEVRYIVHKDGVLVTCDGTPAINWRGDWSELAGPGPQWRVSETKKLFVGADQGDCSWNELRLEPVDPAAIASTLAKAKTAESDSPASKMPDAAKITAARALAKKAFAERINASITLAELKGIFKKIVDARKGKDVSPAERYVLTEMAIDVAARAVQPGTVIKLIDEMAEEFGVEPAKRYAVAFTIMGETRFAKGEEQQRLIVEFGTKLLEDIVRDERLRSAYDIAQVLQRAAYKTGDADLKKRIMDQKADIVTLGRFQRQMESARDQLESDPDNAEANTLVGRYDAFVGGRWPVALRKLAKGDHATLKDLATRELAEPADTTAQYKLALGWYNFGRTTEGRMRREITKHAIFWYNIAAPKMSSLQKEAVPDELKGIKAIKGTGPTVDDNPVVRRTDSLAIGQYVRVRLVGDDSVLSLAEVEVYQAGDDKPLHMAGKASQSSTNPKGGAASRAIDGNTNGRHKSGSVSQTDHQTSPWWVVDLGAIKDISRVRVFNRAKSGKRLKGAILEVLNSHGKVVYAAPFNGVKDGSIHVFKFVNRKKKQKNPRKK